MHEGILIFNAPQDSIMFCNRHAKKIFDLFFSSQLQNCKAMLSSTNFNRLLVSENNLGSFNRENNSQESNDQKSEKLFDVNLTDENMSLE